VPQYEPGRDYRDPEVLARKAAEAQELEELAWHTARCPPPRGLFFADTFSFPFLRTARFHSLMLAGWAVATLAMLQFAIQSGAVDEPNAWINSLIFGAVGGISAAAWICVASACGLTVLRDTSYGFRLIDKWPGAMAIDSVGESVYVFVTLAVAVLPGLVVTPLCDLLGCPKMVPTGISVGLLFPLLLLSMLENNSPMQPFAQSVWQSVAAAWRAWGIFYAITVPAMLLTRLLVMVSLTWLGPWGSLPAGVLLAAAWMIYFRLLGRLAWFCCGRWAEEQEEG
jgi:hypothetical protein